jgi:hypothetical protein
MMPEKSRSQEQEKMKELIDILNFIDTHPLTLGQSRNMKFRIKKIKRNKLVFILEMLTNLGYVHFSKNIFKMTPLGKDALKKLQKKVGNNHG